MGMTGEEAIKRLENQYKRQNEHIRNKYDRISITLPKGTKERIQSQGKSLNGYISELVLADLDRLENQGGQTNIDAVEEAVKAYKQATEPKEKDAETEKAEQYEKEDFDSLNAMLHRLQKENEERKLANIPKPVDD